MGKRELLCLGMRVGASQCALLKRMVGVVSPRHVWWWPLLKCLLAVSPRWSMLLEEVGESGHGWCAGGGRRAFQWLAGCHRHGGILVASQGLPLYLRRSKCCRWAVLAARLPSLGDVACAASPEKGLFGKVCTVSLHGSHLGDALIYTFISSLCSWNSAEQTERLAL